MLNEKQIKDVQTELRDLNVVKEFIDYKITFEYLNLFLEKYSELEGEYGHIQGAVLISLFEFIEKKHPNISQDELTAKAQRLYPVIRAMLHHSRVFELIKKAKKGEIKG